MDIQCKSKSFDSVLGPGSNLFFFVENFKLTSMSFYYVSILFAQTPDVESLVLSVDAQSLQWERQSFMELFLKTLFFSKNHFYIFVWVYLCVSQSVLWILLSILPLNVVCIIIPM